MSNIEAFLKEKYDVGLLTEEKIDYDYDMQFDAYEDQPDGFWGVRDGPNAKQTVSFPVFRALIITYIEIGCWILYIEKLPVILPPTS